jgi:heme exporter protein D
MNWSEFFHMGGYAFYVWSSWGLTFIILLYLFTQSKYRNGKIKKQIRTQIDREKRLEKAND